MNGERGLYEYNMPEGVAAALLRLESACNRDGVKSMRTDFHDGEIRAYIDDKGGHVHYCQHIKRQWFESKEVR